MDNVNKYVLASIVCEYGCGLVSECKSREVADELLKRFDITPKVEVSKIIPSSDK